uniref:hypothetical protein n=1 Tax=Odontella aurita TaxID=265563 RepID=UPI002028D715|nr:hypothetical protein NDF22_mgp06 [Odontella aurita]QYB22963.1 hypothetical protein [Odontella aurita]
MRFRINIKVTKILLFLFILLVFYPEVAGAVHPTEYWVRKTVTLETLLSIRGLSEDLVFYIRSFLPIDLEGWVSQALLRSAETSFSITRGVIDNLLTDVKTAFQTPEDSGIAQAAFDNTQINAQRRQTIVRLWGNIYYSGSLTSGYMNTQVVFPDFGHRFLAIYARAKILSGYTYLPGLQGIDVQQIQSICVHLAHLESAPEHGKLVSGFVQPLIDLMRGVQPLLKPKVLLMIFSLLTLNRSLLENIDIPE